MDWVITQGRFNYERWKKGWQDIFDTHSLINNKRKIVTIKVSAEGDGAFAVVDIDTLWHDGSGNDFHWKGRVCKIYTKLSDGDWKLIAHTGALEY